MTKGSTWGEDIILRSVAPGLCLPMNAKAISHAEVRFSRMTPTLPSLPPPSRPIHSRPIPQLPIFAATPFTATPPLHTHRST